jgi:glycosyltransferase involved in cell wall biosynthesis
LKPRVSVVLPVHDGGDFLAAAVDSILTQTLDRLELIVVDDHSSDGAVGALKRGDKRLRIVSSRGRGVSAAFNTGLENSSAEFIARMDADDISLPNRMALQIEYLEREPGVAICGGCVEIFPREGLGGGNRRYQAWLNACTSPAQIRRELFVESPIPNPTALFRREALEALGGYGNPVWPEDYDLFLRADALGMRMGKPREIVLRWREHPGRLTRTDRRYDVDRFQAAKAHFLARHRLKEARGLVIWGAGDTGRKFHDLLAAEGVSVDGFLDVHPRRIGGKKRGKPVWAPEHIDRLSGSFVLVAVGAAGARRRIRDFMKARGWREGEQYLFVA